MKLNPLFLSFINIDFLLNITLLFQDGTYEAFIGVKASGPQRTFTEVERNTTAVNKQPNPCEGLKCVPVCESVCVVLMSGSTCVTVSSFVFSFCWGNLNLSSILPVNCFIKSILSCFGIQLSSPLYSSA